MTSVELDESSDTVSSLPVTLKERLSAQKANQTTARDTPGKQLLGPEKRDPVGWTDGLPNDSVHNNYTYTSSV